METHSELIAQLVCKINDYIGRVSASRDRVHDNLKVGLNNAIMEEPNNQMATAGELLGKLMADEITVKEFEDIRAKFTKLMFGQIK